MRPRPLESFSRGRPSLELEVLLCCARRSMGREQEARLADLIRRDVDWTRLLRLADRHRVLPLLRFHRRDLPGMPAQVLARLEDLAGLETRHSLLFAAVTLEAMRLLGDQDIRVMPFKGPALAAFLYGDVTLRQCDDIDLLVRPSDVVRARRALLDAGFEGLLPRAGGQLRTFFQSESELTLRRNRVCIDLHWELAPKAFAANLSLDDVWRRARAVQFLGRPILACSAEDLLVLLCVHGAKHRWARIGWICDVAELVSSRPEMCWEQIESDACRCGTARMVRLGLHLASALHEIDLPGATGRWLRSDPVAARLSGEVLEQFDRAGAVAPGSVEVAGFQVAARERLRDKIRYGWRLATVPRETDWVGLPLPNWLGCLAFVYALIRPVRLALVYGSRAIARASAARSS